MGTVAHPVHGAQCRVVQRSFAQVVFQDDMGARDAGGLAEKLRDVGGVVQHINEQANVKRSIGKRKLRAIKRATFDLASWPRVDFHTFNNEIGPALGQQAGDGAVSTTNIEDVASLNWNQRRQRIGKDTGATAKDQGAVAAGDPGERPGRRRGSHRIGSGRKLFSISRGRIHFARNPGLWETAMRTPE